MSKLLRQNVGGTDFTMAGCTLTGVCNSAASDYIKSVTLSDGDVLSDGMTVVVAFTNGNTAGTAPASMTIYSSDQVNYFTDAELTEPFTLAPSGCYEIEYTGTGNVYTYISYPVMQIGSVSGPLCDASGNKASGALWLAGDKVSINYANGCFSVIPQTAGSLTATAASSVVNGAPIRIGSTVRVLFTQDLAGTANTGLVLTYNGVGIPVMVGKNGSLGALLPSDVGSDTYKYLQAYTTLEMMFDGTQFIVLGNPVVLSTSDYTIYTDGSTKYNKQSIDNSINNCLRKSVVVGVANGKWARIQTQYEYQSPTALLVQRYNSSALILQYSDAQPLVRRLSNQAPNNPYTMLQNFKYKKDGYLNNFYIQVGEYGANIAVTLFSNYKVLTATYVNEPPSDAIDCVVISV